MDSVVNNLQLLTDKFKKLDSLASDIDNDLDELRNTSVTREVFSENLKNFSKNRNDRAILRKIDIDHETNAYIKELENTLELIMTKYRAHTQDKIENTKLEFTKVKESFEDCKYREIVEKQSQQINKLQAMMDDFIEEGRKECNYLRSEVVKLYTENKYLRQMLDATLSKETKATSTAFMSLEGENESDKESDKTQISL